MGNAFVFFRRMRLAFMLIFLTLVIMESCDGRKSLHPLFSSYYAEKKDENSLIRLPEIETRIIQDYSQKYYDKILEVDNVITALQYDSINKMYYCNFRKNDSENRLGVQMRYYVANDSLAMTLVVKNLEIGKTGECDYGDWKRASSQNLDLLKKKAKQEDSTAQFLLGLYNSREGDTKSAIDWFTKAAKQGHADAMYYLGQIYEKQGDMQVSFQLFNKAAVSGNMFAQVELGSFYLHEQNKDNLKVILWYTKAAEQGHSIAQLILASCYMFDYGVVEENIQESIKWFMMAAEEGEINAQYALSLFYLNGYGVTKNIEKSEEWRLRAQANNREEIDQQLQLKILGKMFE